MGPAALSAAAVRRLLWAHPPADADGGEASRHPAEQLWLLHQRLSGGRPEPPAAGPPGDRRESSAGGVQSDPSSIWQCSLLLKPALPRLPSP